MSHGLATRAGLPGATGQFGGPISIGYLFSTTTTDADPGNGNLRLSNATQNLATAIRADLVDAGGTNWSAVLATFADSTNPVRGHIRLVATSDATKWLVFTVSAVASPSGYKNITVANVGSSTASPFADGDAVTLTFERTGNVGPTGVLVDLVDGATIATDASLGSVFAVTLGGNRTMSNPTNPVAGQKIVYRLRQDGTGGRTISWDTKFRFSADVPAPTLTPTINKTDYVGFIYEEDTDKWDCVAVSRGY